LRELATSNLGEIGGAYPFQCSLPQWLTETILREHLASLGLAFEFGTEVISVEDDPAGLRVTLKAGDRTEELTASYVLGAGGGHSVTRHAMQEHLVGETYDGRYLVADAKLGMSCPPECGRIIVGPTGFGLFSPLPDGRWLIFVNRDDTAASELPTVAGLSALLNRRAGTDVGVHDLRWVSDFQMHKRLVECLSDGRRFLLGDAAHLSSPLGGEGLNAALLDAADIACSRAMRSNAELPISMCSKYRTRCTAWYWNWSPRALNAASRRYRRPIPSRRSRQRGGAACSMCPMREALSSVRRERRRERLRPASVSPAGFACAGRVTISSSSGRRRASTIFARVGVGWCPSMMLLRRDLTRHKPASPMAELFWFGRMASSVFVPPQPMRRACTPSTSICPATWSRHFASPEAPRSS
jgi:hypothetical protein